jgi:hypothetical protein
LSGKRLAYQQGIERQQRARHAIKNLSVGATVVVTWRGQREAQVIEIRRSRVKAQFTYKGETITVDRSADDVQLLGGG